MEAQAPQAPRPRAPRPGVALAFAVAALLACWNPVAAPFGLVVGLAAAVLGARALRRGGSRRVAAPALAVGVLAALASVVVLALTAGAVGIELPGEPVVKGRSAQELDRVLAEAAERTRSQRERASRELERQAPRPAPDGGPATPPARRGDRR